ncbi:hypothetical protein GCM10023194_60650 [Planotetraspora phitsanulokensis]
MFGQRAVAFWTVVGGVLAVVTFVVTIVPGLASGTEPSPEPSHSPTAESLSPSSPASPLPPSPSSWPSSSPPPTEDPTEEPSDEPSDEPTEEPTYEPSPEPTAHEFAFSYSGSSAYPCSAEGRLHSAYGYASPLTVTNNSPEPIQIFWLDMAGNRQQYSTLQPGRYYRVDSYSNHAWLIADRRDECVKIFGMAAGGAYVIVT